MTVDTTSNPERLFFKQWQSEALFTAYEALDYRERSMVADHLGFCPECYGIYELSKDENGNSVKLLRKGKVYIDLAADHNNDWGEIHYTLGEDDYDVILYVYADRKGGFYFALAGEWVMHNTNIKHIPKYLVIAL